MLVLVRRREVERRRRAKRKISKVTPLLRRFFLPSRFKNCKTEGEREKMTLFSELVFCVGLHGVLP